MSMKACSKCERVKPLEEFHRDASRKDGRQPQCKACKAAYMHARYEANRDEILEKGRAWHAANRDRNREISRAWRAANRAAALERAREWYAANYRTNPQSWWAGRYRRRAREYGHPVIVEDFTRADVVDRYGDACAHCGGPFEELDHYPVPVSQGGPHTLENVRPSCAACNQLSWRAGATTKGKTA